MTRERRRTAGPALILFVIFKLIVGIVPDLMRHAPGVARAMPPPRGAVDGLAGMDGAAFGRAADDLGLDRIADMPVGDVIDLIGRDQDGED